MLTSQTIRFNRKPWLFNKVHLVWFSMRFLYNIISGFFTLSSLSDEDRFNLHKLFTESAERKEDGIESLREQYKSYKQNYVKYLLFDQKKPNLSKYTLPHQSKVSHSYFRCVGGPAYSTGRGVHLLWHSDLWWDWKGRQGQRNIIIKMFAKENRDKKKYAKRTLMKDRVIQWGQVKIFRKKRTPVLNLL